MMDATTGMDAHTVDSAKVEQQGVYFSTAPGNIGLGSGLKAAAVQQDTAQVAIAKNRIPIDTAATNALKWLPKPALDTISRVAAESACECVRTRCL